MATNKTKRKKRPAKRQKKKRSWLYPFLVVAVFVVLTGVFFFIVVQPQKEPLPIQSEDVVGNGDGPPVSYEETAVDIEPVLIDIPGKKDHPRPEGDREIKKERPRIAIVIDDMGYQKKTCNRLIDLDLDLSFAFLPFGPYTKDQAYKAHRLDRDVLLHFPMEASDPKWDPGPGKITINMGRREVRKVFAANHQTPAGPLRN